MFFSSSVDSYEEKLKITLSRLWPKILFEEILKKLCNFLAFVYCHHVKKTYI